MMTEQTGSLDIGRASGRRATRAFVLAVAVTLGVGACGDDGETSDGREGGSSEGGDVTAACDALEVLANEIQGVGDATSVSAVEEQVQGPMDDFTSAAAATGDEELSQLAETASTSFTDYLSGDTQAQLAADAALDAAGARCLQLGATNDFPQEAG